MLGLSGERFRRAEEVKGRNRRDRNGGAEEAMSRRRTRRTRGRCGKRRGRVAKWILTRRRVEMGKIGDECDLRERRRGMKVILLFFISISSYTKGR